MNIIHQNHFYKLAFDEGANRIYFHVFGFWPSKFRVPNYLENWKTAIAQADENFTILADLSTAHNHPFEIVAMHRKIETLLSGESVLAISEIHGSDTSFNFSFQGDHVKVFKDIQEGERWLDQVAYEVSNNHY